MAIKISDIKSSKTRNMTRGLLSVKEHDDFEKALKSIESSASQSDWNLVLTLLRQSNLFVHSDSSREFIKVLPFTSLYIPFPSSDVFQKTLLTNQNKIIQILKVYISIIDSINDSNFDEVICLSEVCRKLEGVSLVLLRLLLFARTKVLSLGNESVTIDTEIHKIKVNRFPEIYHSLREILNSKVDYLNTRERLSTTDDSFSSKIVKNIVDPFIKSEDDFHTILGCYFSISLLDSIIYYNYAKTIYTSSRYAELISPTSIENTISTFVNKSLDFSSIVNSKINQLDTYRLVTIIPFLNNNSKYYFVHTCLYGRNIWKTYIEDTTRMRIADSFFCEINTLEDIRTTPPKPQKSLDVFTPNESSEFERSLALVYLLNKCNGMITNDVYFIKLMSVTRDIGHICNPDILSRIKNNTTNKDLQIVVSCLLHINNPCHSIEHELRSVIQDELIEKYDNNFVSFLEHITIVSQSVADHLMIICDEDFISKFFRIVESTNQALIIRSSMLKWYSKVKSDSTYIDRAKLLDIQVQTNRAKGAVDDHRIYVDPVRFAQWVNDNLINDMVLYIDQMNELGEDFPAALEWNKKFTRNDSVYGFANLLNKAYYEFCANMTFGITSYLGRRIRHGTIMGTCTSVINEIIGSELYQHIKHDSDFYDSFISWKDKLISSIEDLKNNNLQIFSDKKPNGLIFPFFNSEHKKQLANHLAHSIIKMHSIDHLSTDIPYTMIEYCWVMVEEDLNIIRVHIERLKSQSAKFTYSNYPRQSTSNDILSFCRELNNSLGTTFKLISSWFNRPANTSGSSSLKLIIQMIIEECKSSFGRFSIEQVFMTDDDIIITGRSFLLINDIASILIRNAIKHGDASGKVFFAWNLSLIFEKTFLSLEVRSSTPDIHNASSIITKLLDSECSDADSQEGLSGIKKLKKMQKDNYIESVSYNFNLTQVIANVVMPIGISNETTDN